VSLVTLDQAKKHLRLDIPTTPTPDPEDADLTLKLVAAEALVLNYIGEYGVSPPRWTDHTDCDPIIQAAILMVFSELYAFRGDNPGTIMSAPARDPGASFTPVVEGMLGRFKYRVIA